MRDRPLLRAATILGLAVAGLVGAHAAAYVIAVPEAHDRAMLLAATGHSYLPSAAWMALTAGVAAVVSGVAAGYLRQRRSATFTPSAIALGLVQCGGYLALEIGERVLNGTPLGSLSVGVVLIGLACQIACALLLALVVVGLRRLGETLAATRRVPAGPRGPHLFGGRSFARSRSFSALRVRGPPRPLAV